MKRLLPVVVALFVCAILTQSFKPIPNPIDDISVTPSFSYAKFMQVLWLKPLEKVKVPVASVVFG